MVGGRKLLEMARKWHKMAAASRRRVSSARPVEKVSGGGYGSLSYCRTPGKGKFVVYSRDGSRFIIPLVYLDSSIFRELLLMSEEEFGLPAAGPIVIPCDAPLLAQVVSLLRRPSSPDAQRAVIAAIYGNRCSSSHHPGGVGLWSSAVHVY